MLQFHSGSIRAANPQRAIEECMTAALGADSHDCDLVIINASIGHNLQELLNETRRLCPNARIVAASCAGVVGREGVSESTKDVAIMAIRGKEFAVAHVDGIHGSNSYDISRQLAMTLKSANAGINMIYVMAPGIDIANDRVIEGIESVFGSGVTLFGATSSDNMKGIRSFQAIDLNIYEHSIFAVGFADPTLEVFTQATHGFIAKDEPMTVTKAQGNRITEIDGRPAWPEYLSRLGLPTDSKLADTIPIGAAAERLEGDLATSYGNEYILRVITHTDPDGALIYATECPEGTRIWLTARDEEMIFSDLDRLIGQITEKAQRRKPVAVFQADCLARGRRLFNRILKEELVQRMQFPFSTDGLPPPWLGMYGFGEYARLGEQNAYHNYTTALAAIYRK